MQYQVEAIDITSNCPCNCPGCFYEDEGDMSVKEFKTVIDNSPDSIKRLELSGGEPLIHPDIVELCKYASIEMVRPQILTSGVEWSEELIKKLVLWIDSIKVSMHYPDVREDSFKKVEGAFKNSIELLQFLQHTDVDTYIYWIVEEGNFDCYEDMIKIAESTGSELKPFKYLPFQDEDRTISWDKFSQIREYPKNHCPAGVLRFSVKVDGKITPCIYMDNAFGNIFRDSFEKIGERMTEWRRNKGEFYKKCIISNELGEQE